MGAAMHAGTVLKTFRYKEIVLKPAGGIRDLKTFHYNSAGKMCSKRFNLCANTLTK